MVKTFKNNMIVDVDVKCKHATFWFNNSISGCNFNSLEELSGIINNQVCVRFENKDSTYTTIQYMGVLLDNCIMSRALHDCLKDNYNIVSKILPVKRLNSNTKTISRNYDNINFKREYECEWTGDR